MKHRHRTWLFLAAVVALLLVLAAASASARPGFTFAGAGCPRSESAQFLPSQSMRGAVTGCLRLGSLGPGAHSVVLEQVLNDPASGQARVSAGPRARGEPAVAVSLSPSEGPPGTVVTVTGRLRRAVRGQLQPYLCWDGCRAGLRYELVNAKRVSARMFRARLVVPAAPWIEAAPNRVAPLRSGAYAISVACLVDTAGCDGSTEGSAEFDLRDAHSPSWCPTAAGCARLRVVPAAAGSGQVVKVTGFAPLVSVIGSNQPFAYQLKVISGPPHGHQVRFSTGRNVGEADFGHGTLGVARLPSFASLGTLTTLASLSAGLPSITADPRDPSAVAWCTGAQLEVSSPGARTVTVPTASALSELHRLRYSSGQSSAANCQTVIAVGPPGSPSSDLLAAFLVNAAVPGPPFYELALSSHDGGASWSPVPVPAGSDALGFGGFRDDGAAVQAVYSPVRRGRGLPELLDGPVLAERTLDAGRDWAPAPLLCPTAGPCVTLGPFAPGHCAGNGSDQTILRSGDGGDRYTTPALPDLASACDAAQLVATGPRSELLVNPDSLYPLVESTDGGVSWRVIGLPRAPGQIAGDPIHAGLILLPSGALLETGVVGFSGLGHFSLLAPGAKAWCTVRSPVFARPQTDQLAPVTLIGDQLYWLSGTGSAASLERVPAASVSCA
ncbi:MAG: hypothetical protein M3Y17_13525 [Actinomycetota bacterium]|nr:hypothetical protein [Actinomycetota bacterium]